jgi:hypothetical protein
VVADDDAEDGDACGADASNYVHPAQTPKQGYSMYVLYILRRGHRRRFFSFPTIQASGIDIGFGFAYDVRSE